MRAYVTGGSGFVGGWLREHLLFCGDEVVSGPEEVDVTDADTIAAAIAAARPDAVFHLAARAHVGESWEAPAETFLVNALGTLNVVQAARRCQQPPTVLVVGSAEVYGRVRPDDMPLREDRLLAPVTPYAASKAAAEDVGLQAWLGWEVPVIRVRAFNHAGPAQASTFLVSGLARRIADAERSGEEVLRVGNLDARRDFTDVRDVVRAYRLLVERGRPGEVYNVCSGRGVAVRDVAAGLLSRAVRPLRLEVDADLVRPIDVSVLVGDPGRLHAATGWSPEVPLATTLADSLEYWRRSLGASA